MIKYIKGRCSREELDELFRRVNSDNLTLQAFDTVAQDEWDRAAVNENSETLDAGYRQAEQLLNGRLKAWIPFHRFAALRRISIGAVAAVLFVTGIFWVFGRYSTATSASTEWITYQSGIGEIVPIELPDGSLVTLNAQSSLRYSSDFGKSDRCVALDGEAFFDVTSDARKPFKIRSGELDVIVLGTSFDVKNYMGDEKLSVTVGTGKVKIGYNGDDLNLNLTAGERMVLDTQKGTLSRGPVESEKEFSWMSGKLVFDRQTMSEVVRMINRYYDSRITLCDTTVSTLISGMHDNCSLDAVLESICFSSKLKYRKEPGGYIIY